MGLEIGGWNAVASGKKSLGFNIGIGETGFGEPGMRAGVER